MYIMYLHVDPHCLFIFSDFIWAKYVYLYIKVLMNIILYYIMLLALLAEPL